MIRNDRIINSLIHGDAVNKLIKENGIDITEARAIISEMSFKEYCSLDEASADITPPSGQKISTGPGQTPGTPNSSGQQSQPATPASSQAGSPPADPRGVQVKNPQTGKVEWMKPSVSQSGQAVAEDKDLVRMQQLAGIKENASCGATGAGSIAVAPAAQANVRRRQPTNEQPKEYEPKVAKTVVGDTKPNQATGLLSANLAAKNKPAAGRTNNGFKK